MAIREQARRLLALAWLGVAGCREPATSVEPSERPPARPAPVLSDDDEALIASLLSDDPGDFYAARARIWRFGPARWSAEAPEFPARPNQERGGALEQAIEVVVVDRDGPRVLLPLDELYRTTPSLRLVASVGPSDLVTGLTRELAPTPWLTLAAGIPLSPLEGNAEQLRVRWADPACGFALDLAIDPDAFGPLYEPGPSGRPNDEPDNITQIPRLALAPGAQVFAEPEGRTPIVALDPMPASDASWLDTAQRVRTLGEPGKRQLQQIELRCRGVTVRGYVSRAAIVERPVRLTLEAAPPQPSSCADFEAAPVRVPAGTPLFEPELARPPAVVGVVASELELAAAALPDGWWRACVASPWGDLFVDFRLR